MWEHATAEEHAFLLIDYDGSKDMMFRKNFDTVLTAATDQKNERAEIAP